MTALPSSLHLVGSPSKKRRVLAWILLETAGMPALRAAVNGDGLPKAICGTSQSCPGLHGLTCGNPVSDGVRAVAGARVEAAAGAAADVMLDAPSVRGAAATADVAPPAVKPDGHALELDPGCARARPFVPSQTAAPISHAVPAQLHAPRGVTSADTMDMTPIKAESPMPDGTQQLAAAAMGPSIAAAAAVPFSAQPNGNAPGLPVPSAGEIAMQDVEGSSPKESTAVLGGHSELLPLLSG